MSKYTEAQIQNLTRALESSTNPGAGRYVVRGSNGGGGQAACFVAHLALLEGVTMEQLESWEDHTVYGLQVARNLPGFARLSGYSTRDLHALQAIWDLAAFDRSEALFWMTVPTSDRAIERLPEQLRPLGRALQAKARGEAYVVPVLEAAPPRVEKTPAPRVPEFQMPVWPTTTSVEVSEACVQGAWMHAQLESMYLSSVGV